MEPLEKLIVNYEVKTPSEFQPEKDYQSGARIIKVTKNELPENVLGMYIPSQHAIYVRTDISNYEEQFVRAHESEHALGETDELKTDAKAAARVGYNLRGLRRAA